MVALRPINLYVISSYCMLECVKEITAAFAHNFVSEPIVVSSFQELKTSTFPNDYVNDHFLTPDL